MRIEISLARQTLRLFDAGGQELRCYSVSTSARGAGEERGSYRTPRGRHVIRACIGHGQPLNSVVVARRPSGEVYGAELAADNPQRDWILTRILWLSGCECGFNRLGNVDTMRRYIYIHGTPDGEPMGTPASHGCVRMRNTDILELFEWVSRGTPVDIYED